MESNSVCNHTRDKKIGRPRSVSPICLSRVSVYRFVYHEYQRKGTFALKCWQRRRKLFQVALKLRLVDLNYNFECDWLIELSDNKLNYSTLLPRVQISRETSTNNRYLYSPHSSRPREVQNLGKSEFWEKKSSDNESLIRRFGV